MWSPIFGSIFFAVHQAYIGLIAYGAGEFNSIQELTAIACIKKEKNKKKKKKMGCHAAYMCL